MSRDAPTLSSPPQANAATGDVRIVAGRYALRRVLGRGGMGVVYEAENTWTHRRVALKVLDPERTSDPVQVERFMREARATSALRHPNVVDVLDMGQDAADGALYIVQELLVGEDLKALLEREGHLDEARARAILAPVLKGLAAAHAAGIVHRDVKPANLFLSKGPDGEEVPKVIDFGIARDMARDLARTGTGETIGTPAYMAPEQLRAERALTPAVDVWALGVVLHEMLAGATPFPSENYLVLVHRVLAGERPPLETSLAHVSPAMRALVERALDPDASKRFASAAAMLVALDADLADTHPAPRAAASPHRNRAAPVALAAAALAALSLAAVLYARAPAAPVVRPPTPQPTPVATVPPAAPAAPLRAAPATDADAAVAPSRPRAHLDRPRPHTAHTDHGSHDAPQPLDASAARPRAPVFAPGGDYPSQ